MINRMIAFLKKETVLCVSLLLAIVSAFIVPPDGAYLGYIDFRTLAVLFCLMSVMAGLQKIGVFKRIAGKLLGHVRSGRSLVLTLVLLCFFSGMVITNDVALITFVPFTFTVLSLLLLAGWSLIQGRACPQTLELEEPIAKEDSVHGKEVRYLLLVYGVLFLLCLLTVGHILPWQAVFAAVLIIVFITDRQVFAEVDYSLLFTFVGFFIFIGNVGRISVFREFLQSVIVGREIYTAIIASQVISNVPASLLLSGFTENFAGLIIGTNLGGLGTLIASMASLISYKYVVKGAGERKGGYIALFTAGNVCFLAALILLNLLLEC